MRVDRAELLAFTGALTRRRAGFDIPRGSGAVELRLGTLARREGLDSVWTMLSSIRRQPDSKLAAEAVEALAPRDTWFFRDRAPFQHFADAILPEALMQAGPTRAVRIWSAGCGAGQEAYSLAMLAEERRARGVRVDAAIVATDLSRAAVRRGAQGVYDQFEVQRGLPIRRLVEHFDKEGEDWRVNSALRRMVDFRLVNFLRDFSALGEFDVIFLRHVLTHMSPQIHDRVLGRVMDHLRPDGWLVLGPWETPGNLAADLDPAPGVDGVFRKRPEARADRRVEPRAA